jgi:transporter family protein
LGLWAFLPKLAIRYLDPRSAVLYEAVGGLRVALVILVGTGATTTTDVRGAALALPTGVPGMARALAELFAAARGSVVLTAPSTALYPLLAVVLAPAFLHEPVSARQWLGIGLVLVAIALISS